MFISNQLQDFMKIVPVFDPLSKRRILLQTLILIVYLFMTFSVPLKLALMTSWESIGMDILMKLSLVLLSFNSLLSINTGFFQEGQLIVQKKKIFSNYSKNYLFPDALTVTILAIDLNYDFNHNFSILIFFIQFTNFFKIL